MITKWTLRNFKAVSEKTELKFEPLTIFAGANSSGKSTIIQSILLTAQTIQNPVTSRSVVLNGHISKFGNFNDILSHNATANKEIEIGFTLIPRMSSNKENYLSQRFMFPFREEFTNIDLSFSFFSNEEQINQLNPTLNTLLITSSNNDKIKQKYNIKKSNKTVQDKITEYKIKSLSNIDKQALEYEVEFNTKAKSNYHFFRLPKGGKYIGVNLMHFLPDSITAVYNELDEEISYILEILAGKQLFNAEVFDHENIIFNTEIKELLINIFEELIKKTDLDNKVDEPSISAFKINVGKLKKKFSLNIFKKCITNKHYQGHIASEFEAKKDIIISILKKIPTDDYIKTLTFPLHLSEVNYIETHFKRNLKYLGPLRDEPKAIYPLEGYADSTDVGFKGENTAAVLEIHKNTMIEYIPSSEFTNNKEQKVAIQSTLQDAVLDWLLYLGVATNFKTSDKGKLGHELTVSIDGTNNFQDLTHVGVGVSQVLPILVLSLLADSDSTLIFEQPELHLHPKVQTRLADFFISQNLIEKQCIVETHSEYLINRLRYLIAISEGETLSKNSILYFVEKENSLSKYSEVRINKFGVIKEWPKGFFDESESLATKMLEAAMNKRKKEMGGSLK